MDPGDSDAHYVTDRLAGRTLVASIIAAPAMICSATILVVWFVAQEVDRGRMTSWLVAVALTEVAIVGVSWWGHRDPLRRMTATNVVTTASGVLFGCCGLLSVWGGVPDTRADVAMMYQLWVCGTAAVAMAIAGAMTRAFVTGTGAMLAVNVVLIATGAAGVPRVLAPVALMYLVVLTFCHLGVRNATREAVASELRAQRLLDELAEANDALSHEATHDLLTGIANRRRIIGELEAGLARIGKDISEIAVLFVDLDGFKAVNDTYGHAVGDDLLVLASERIGDLVGAGDLVGRQGGDEFIVLVRSSGRAEVQRLAERIRSALESSFRIGEHLVSVSASIGLVWCDRVGLAADDVLRDADLAQYRAKDHGRNCVIEYRRNGPIRVDDRSRSVAELREALHDQVIRPYYQPVVDLDSGRIIGAEALARWPLPDGTVLAPAQFLRALTEAGLDTDLGIHMALQIMTLRSEIAPLVPESFRLGLNVTFRRSRAKDVVDALVAMKTWVTPTGGSVVEGMMLELTENVAVRDLEETRRELERARSIGLAIALDDFGTGHSSLTLVRQLPLDVIKIDRGFVHGIADDRANEAVVSAVVHLANGVGARVVAEGVERVDDALRLRELGCSLAQGFLYAPAVTGDTLRDWLEHGAPWQQPMQLNGVGSPTRTPLAVTPRSTRAIQSPGASISFGVGNGSGSVRSRASSCSPTRSTTPCTKPLPRAIWSSPTRMPSNRSTNTSSASFSARRRRTASAMRRASPPMTRTATASTTQSVYPTTAATAASSRGWSAICSGDRTAPNRSSGSPKTRWNACIGSAPASEANGSNDPSLSAIEAGSGRNPPTWVRTRPVSASRRCSIEKIWKPDSSCASTHTRISSTGISHSRANVSIVSPTRTTSWRSRGIGRSCRPKTRCARDPTIDPTAMPIIAGAIMRLMPDIICTNGSTASTSSFGTAGCWPSELARSVNSGR